MIIKNPTPQIALKLWDDGVYNRAHTLLFKNANSATQEDYGTILSDTNILSGTGTQLILKDGTVKTAEITVDGTRTEGILLKNTDLAIKYYTYYPTMDHTTDNNATIASTGHAIHVDGIFTTKGEQSIPLWGDITIGWVPDSVPPVSSAHCYMQSELFMTVDATRRIRLRNRGVDAMDISNRDFVYSLDYLRS